MSCRTTLQCDDSLKTATFLITQPYVQSGRNYADTQLFNGVLTTNVHKAAGFAISITPVIFFECRS